jgi:uncharacterized membrane protein
VFAIAVTLLILEIRVPRLPAITNVALIEALGGLWPSFVAFLMSFFVIFVMWVSHHELIRLVRHVDYPFLFANGLLLLVVTFIPFPTALLAQYLGTAAANTAVAFYCATFFVTGIAYNLLFAAVAHNRRLVHSTVSDELLAGIKNAYRLGLVVYAISTGVSFWSAPAGLLLCASLWVLWVKLGYRG